MNKKTSAAIAAIALSLAMTGGPAVAGVGECLADIDSLQAELAFFCDGSQADGKEILGGNPARTCESLNSKLDGAREKLDALKLERAKQKLVDFDDAIYSLENAAKPKIIGDTSGLDAAEAIDCVQTLIDSL